MKKTLALVALLASTVAFAKSTPDPLQQAREKAEAWLALMDGGKYAGTWDQAGELFQKKTQRAAWSQQLSQAREMLGKVTSRELVSVKLTEKVPGAPAGKYVVLEYKTAFEKQPEVVEMVTPALGSDGVWRVAGYSIHGRPPKAAAAPSSRSEQAPDIQAVPTGNAAGARMATPSPE